MGVLARVAAAGATAIAALCFAQTPQQPTLDQLLPRLLANGQKYEAALPSLSCNETIDSEIWKKGRVKEDVKLEATLRVRRSGDPARPFAEAQVFTSRNRTPVTDQSKVEAPYFVAGVFVNGLGFASPDRLRCLDMTLTQAPAPASTSSETGPLLLEMHRRLDAEGNPACSVLAPGYVKKVEIDQSMHITHVERTLPADVAERRNEVPYASIDYAPVTLGDEQFWLPLRAELRDPTGEHRMTVQYSGCRRYTGTLTIVGAPEKVAR